MYAAGQSEIDAIAKVIRSKKLFRYTKHSQCERFEKRFATRLRVAHCHLTSSGTTALTAALTGLGIGPGDEVIVPAHTYMATAVAVLATGAIPVITDIDESLTLSAEALADAIGPRTRAVIPVHMWGQPADMDAILRVARKKKLLVLEDACQAVGGGYEGRMLGSLGHAGAFSFNYFKNISCGEGGAFVTNDPAVFATAKCNVDCCSFYWTGRRGDVVPFTASGSRASEIEGAMLNAQLDRLPSLLRSLRAEKEAILGALRDTKLTPSPRHSPRYECGSTILFRLPTAAQASEFARITGHGIAGKTGRHNSTEWDPVLKRHGHPHPALDPFKLPANRKCRKDYRPQRWATSLAILDRTVMVGTRPDRSSREMQALIRKLRDAAQKVVP